MKDLLGELDPARVKTIMAAVAKQRRHERQPCEVCGVEMDALAVQRYCSNRCRQRAKYARRRAKSST